MAWYSDEEYEFRKDCGEKKNIAASSHKQRTHCGKGGRIKFPSDYMSRKELKAMNGEVVTYKPVKPIKWDDFKVLSCEEKVNYIGWIRRAFGATNSAIAEMFGVAHNTLMLHLVDLKIADNETNTGKGKWNKDGFCRWAYPTQYINEGRENEDREEVSESTEEIPVMDITPMKWAEFKKLSDTKKSNYITTVRAIFNVSDTEIAKMFGVSRKNLTIVITTLGLGRGKGYKCVKPKLESFWSWAGCEVRSEPVEEDIDEITTNTPICEALEAPVSGNCEVPEGVVNEIKEVTETPDEPEAEVDILDEVVEDLKNGVPAEHIESSVNIAHAPIVAIPKSGSMTFESPACMAMATLQALLGSVNVRLKVEWEVVE